MLYARLRPKGPWHKAIKIFPTPCENGWIVDHSYKLECAGTESRFYRSYRVDLSTTEPRRNRCKRCWPRPKRRTRKRFNRACAPIIAMRDEQDR
jgi:hypothetical protein